MVRVLVDITGETVDMFNLHLKPQREKTVRELISELVNMESDYYDKHCYFSFWSPSMKIGVMKRICKVFDVLRFLVSLTSITLKGG